MTLDFDPDDLIDKEVLAFYVVVRRRHLRPLTPRRITGHF